MDIDIIFKNVNRMLEYRINSHKIKFDVQFKEFNGESGEATEKLKYEITTNEIGGHIAKYMHNDKLYKTVYLNIDIGHTKSLVGDEHAIILHLQNDRKIKKLIKSHHLCQFFASSMFLNDYRSNVYFTYMCKSSESALENSNLQYISSRDFTVMYCGLREGDVALAISIVDPTLILPQLRIVKRDSEYSDDDNE